MRILTILGLVSAFLLIRLAEHESLGVVGNPVWGESTNSGFFDLTTILGVIIVFMFYWFKFNEWAGPGIAPKGFRSRPARHFTTWLRFIGWNTFYGLLMVGVYAVIVFFPEQIFRVLGSFTTASATLKTAIPVLSEAQKLFDHFPVSNPISAAELAPFAVMLTTVVWAGMQPFSEFERRFRLRLQEHAAIPSEAKRLIEIFKKEMENFVPDDKIICDILKDQNGYVIQKEHFYDSGDNLWFLMARAQYLFHLLLKYNREPVFSRLAERYNGEFVDLEAKMRNVHALAAQHMTEIQRIVIDEKGNQKDAPLETKIWNTEKRIQPEMLRDAERLLAEQLESAAKFQRIYFQKQEKHLRSAIKKTFEDMLQLIVCSVLAVGRSRQQCQYLLQAFGLKQRNQITNQLDSVVVIWVAGGALLIAFICSLVYYYAQQLLNVGESAIIPTDVNMVFYWAVTSSLLHLLATVGGYFCQRGLENGRERLQLGGMEERPLSVMAQVAEASCSASFGFALSIFLLGTLMALGDKFVQLKDYWWWAFVPAVTAFFAAFYTQRVKRSKRQLKRLIWTQGLATGLVTLVVYFILNSGNLSKTWLFGCYAITSAIVLGVAMSIILQTWTEGVEKTADKIGEPDQRKEKRQHPPFRRAKWTSVEGEEIAVRVLNVSSSGAGLETTTPLTPKTEGMIKIIGRKEQRAVVVRNANGDDHHIYVEFLDNAA